MSRIIILDDVTRAQIAAGEVVERPGSVVKELVENSLDAKASKIIVEIIDGGLGSIAVIDNGWGMTAEELKLAFQRHATSKIKCAADLTRVLTYGFRGEALPSIASVSKVTVLSRTPEEITGTKLEIEGGKFLSLSTAGCPVGTHITVNELFFNTPVRRKSMKKPYLEGAICAEIISRLSLARADVSFELRQSGRRVFFTPGTGRMIDVIACVYGIQTAKEMVEINGGAESEGIVLRGFAGKPSLSRSTSQHVTTIVNGRYVRCRAIVEAVEDVYKNLLPQNRKPVAVISVDIDPEEVDINVHPSKLEVKLLSEKRVTDLVSRLVHGALYTKSIIPRVNFAVPQSKTCKEVPVLEVAKQAGEKYFQKKISLETAGSTGTFLIKEEEQKGYETELENPQKGFPRLYPLAQLPPTYILAFGEDGLYIIDQHAAHERVLYERFFTVKKESLTQCLMVPVVLETNYGEAALIKEKIDWFLKAGFLLEHFGGNSFIIRGVPWGTPPGKERELVLDLVGYLVKEKGLQKVLWDDFLRKTAALVACKGAVKSGEKLTTASMTALLDELFSTKDPFTCPHGRPTAVCITYQELQARFKR